MERINLKQYLRDEEKRFVIMALEATKNNKNQAADLLCLNRTTLIEKCRKLGLHEYLHRPRGEEFGYKWVKVPME